MSAKPDGGPAFPSLERFEKFNDNAGTYVEHFAPVGGMSLRDYFAVQALTGFCAGPMTGDEFRDLAAGVIAGGRFAKAAYVLADAMLAERAK